MTSRYRPYGHHSAITSRQIAAGVAVAAVLAIGTGTAAHHHRHSASDASPVVSRAITYARHQLGKAYCWGGTGPSCYDCSGLAMRAEQSARVSIPRTSELQFADGHRVSHPERGDLVFFAGADGSATSPGHVGLVLGPHRMIEAYATGWPIRVSSFGLPTSPEGDTNPVGFTRPGVR